VSENVADFQAWKSKRKKRAYWPRIECPDFERSREWTCTRFKIGLHWRSRWNGAKKSKLEPQRPPAAVAALEDEIVQRRRLAALDFQELMACQTV